MSNNKREIVITGVKLSENFFLQLSFAKFNQPTIKFILYKIGYVTPKYHGGVTKAGVG